MTEYVYKVIYGTAHIEYDIMSDTNKSRKCGFLEWVDTEEMLFRLFTQFQKIRFIPSL